MNRLTLDPLDPMSNAALDDAAADLSARLTRLGRDVTVARRGIGAEVS
ncbi:hypothetical protein ACFFGH_20920 [Lysobacter korlensis]|uniref:Uncharacterized protein n=1 Tax=Lysobacter korlensis TaxID=553636 RepID=A0ABV6RTJ8_9GAMM